jgi:hypothetical protein
MSSAADHHTSRSARSTATSTLPTLLTLLTVLTLLLAAPASAQATPPKSSTTISRVRLHLAPEIGYQGYLAVLGTHRVHGPRVGGAAIISWGANPRLGVRIAAHVGRLSGDANRSEGNHPGLGFDETVEAKDLWWVDGSVGAFALLPYGLWGSASLGLYGYEYNAFQGGDKAWGPEMILTVGYALQLGDYVALKVSVEAATQWFVTLRGAANASVMISF